MVITMQLGYGVRAYRKDRGWNQQTLAERAGIDQSNISKLETNQTKPLLETAIRIAEALEITLDELLARCANEMKREEVA